MQAVTAILILGAIASLVAWVILLLLEHGIRPVHSMVHFVRRLPWGGRLAVLPLFIALVVVGSTKFSGNNVSDGNNLQMTNAVEGVVSGGVAVGRQDAPVTNSESDMPNSEQESIGAAADEVTSSGSAGAETQIQLPVNDGEIAVPDSITALDCEAGFVLSGVGYGEEFDFAPPENAVVCEDWLRFGAHEDWIYIGPGAWSSRFGSNFVETVRVFSCGGIDFFPEGHISLLNNPISIAPAANWHLLSVSNSMFWHAETPSNTLLLAWQNALLNRQSNSLVNIQAELFPSGKMRITHDLSGEAATEYVPAPQLPPHVPLAEVKGRFADGNTNAYYYADVVVEKGPAIVTVRCGAETALGDYAVVACPGETNRLPFLIGPKYEVESEAAFAHFGVAEEEVLQTNLADRIVGLQWPVEISFEEGYAESGKMFEMSVEPDFLEGSVFSGSGRARSGTVGCACGCDVGTNGVVRISEDCNCNPCTIRGRYGYEGYGEEFEFNYYPEEDGEEEPADPEEPVEPPEEPKPSVSVWFDKSAVIFEDEYENSPGETVPRRSTRTTLKCAAYGGERGGNLTVDLSGMGALKLVSGTPPSSRTLAQYETVEFEAVYEGEAASSQENGTVAKAKFTENETDVTFEDDAEVTVIKITTETDVEKPSYRQRKNIGVGEVVEILIEPKDAQVEVFSSRGNLFQNGSGAYMYDTPTSRQNDDITIKSELVEMLIQLCIFEPSGFSVRGIVGTNSNAIGEAGDFSAKIFYYPLPTNVSFHAIEFVEVGMVSSDPTGYFADEARRSWLDHSLWGAGEWFKLAGYDDYFVDDIAMPPLPKPWGTGGAFTWPVPVGWRCAGEKGVTNIVCYHNQRFELEANGTSRIKKMGCIVERGTNNYFSATRSF